MSAYRGIQAGDPQPVDWSDRFIAEAARNRRGGKGYLVGYALVEILYLYVRMSDCLVSVPWQRSAAFVAIALVKGGIFAGAWVAYRRGRAREWRALQG